MVELGAIVIGFTQVAKQYGVPSKWLPILAIVIAVALTTGIAYNNGTDLVGGVLSGLVLGLTSTGLYGAGKNIVNAKSDAK